MCQRAFLIMVFLAAGVVAPGFGRVMAQNTPSRIPPLADADLTDHHRALIASYVRPGQLTNDVRTLLNHPDSLPGVMPFWNYIAFESTLPVRDRAILMLRTAWLSNSRYMWSKIASAAPAALSPSDLRRLGTAAAQGAEPFDSVLIRMADTLHRQSFVDDGTWAMLKGKYSTEQLMDAVFTVAETSMLAMTLNSLEVPPDRTFSAPVAPVAPVPSPTAREHPVLATPRIPPLDQTFWTGELRALLDPDATGREIAAVYRTFANHPALYRPRQELSEYIRLKSTLPDRVRELAILRIGFLCASDYEWGAHARAGRAAGLTADEIRRIADRPLTGWTSADAAILQAADELFARDVVSDATWRRLSAQFDRRQMIDLLITIGGYRMVSMALNTFGVPLEAGSERLPGPR